MSQVLVPTLPSFDCRLLTAVQKLVPRSEREQWLRAWQAELWHVHHDDRQSRLQAATIMIDLAIGLVRDALWLRTEDWRKAFSGTAVLCLGTLASLILLCTLIDLALVGGAHSLWVYIRMPILRCLVAAPLVLFVSLATGLRRHAGRSSARNRGLQWKQALFFPAKVIQIMVVALLLSVALCFPLHTFFPYSVELLQILCFVLSTLAGMRWAIRDQELRCKECLRSLAMPAQVGRPSHNLLEWNGIELSCKQGHGLLSIPEMETSWRRSSEWVEMSIADTK
jgi:hypothetical protein